MKSILYKSTAILALGALTACSTGEVGNEITANFGAAVTNNHLAQSVKLRSGYLQDLSAQFRASAPDMINFAFNSADLDAEAQAILAQQAAWIRANPQIALRIYGHTDKVGSTGYNQRLGLRRAQAAVAYLRSQGVRRGQVQAVASFGETRPLVNTQNRERLNRRTVTQVVGVHRHARGFDFDGKVANGIYNEYAGIGAEGGDG